MSPAFAVTLISLFIFSSCGKQDLDLQQAKLDKYKDYEKYVEYFRLSTEEAIEIIEHFSTIEPSASEDYNNYIREIVNSTPEQIIERQNQSIEKTLKAISKYPIAKLDEIVEGIEKNSSNNKSLSENNISAGSRASLNMDLGGSIFGLPPSSGNLELVGTFTNGSTSFFTSDVLFPKESVAEGKNTHCSFINLSGDNHPLNVGTCYNGIYLTLAYVQNHSNASRSAFFWGYNGSSTGASIYVPQNSGDSSNPANWSGNFELVTINGTCSNVEPAFANFGQNTGCVGSHQVYVTAPFGTLFCN